MVDVSFERLRELLDYDPETGVFVWRQAPSRKIRIGSAAGSLSKHLGYWMIGIDKIPRYAHHLAFLWMTGGWPAFGVDHRDGDRTNNRWANLRLANQSQNLQNAPHWGHNTSGHIGVGQRDYGAWRATITIDGQYHHIGTYSTFEAARDAYLTAKAKLHTFQPTLRKVAANG